MKRVVECDGCGKLVGLYKSYKVKITKINTIPGVPRSVTQQEDTYTGRLCPGCTEAAGYKVRRA